MSRQGIYIANQMLLTPTHGGGGGGGAGGGSGTSPAPSPSGKKGGDPYGADSYGADYFDLSVSARGLGLARSSASASQPKSGKGIG